MVRCIFYDVPLLMLRQCIRVHTYHLSGNLPYVIVERTLFVLWLVHEEWPCLERRLSYGSSVNSTLITSRILQWEFTGSSWTWISVYFVSTQTQRVRPRSSAIQRYRIIHLRYHGARQTASSEPKADIAKSPTQSESECSPHLIPGATNVFSEGLCAYHCCRVKALRPVIFAIGLYFHR